MPSKKSIATFSIDGKRYYVRADSKEEAQELAQKKKAQLGGGFSSTSYTVSSWFDEYIEVYKADIQDKTRKDYYVFFNNGIKPYIGKMRLDAVKPIHCQMVMNRNADKSASYVHKVYVLMRGMFQSAVDNDLILKNPSRTTTKPNAEKGTRRALTDKEREAFLKAADDTGEAGLFCKIIYYCGLRPSEVNRIQGGDYSGDMLKVRGTKTAASHRTVPIPSSLSLPKLKKGKLLFSLQSGGERDAAGSRRYWIRVRHKMESYIDVPDDLTMYCLRHDYCTRLQEAGVPIDVARRLMGHSSVEVTSRIYTHENASTILQARDLINECF